MNSQTKTTKSAFVRVITQLEIIFAVCLITAIIISVALQIIQRETGLTNLSWSGEIARLSLVLLTSVIAPVLAQSDGHITLYFIDRWLPKKMIGYFWVVSRIYVSIVSLSILWGGWILIEMDKVGNLSSLHISKAPFFIVVAISFGLVTLQTLANLITNKFQIPPDAFEVVG